MPDGIVGGTENSQGKLVIICNFMLIAEKKGFNYSSTKLLTSNKFKTRKGEQKATNKQVSGRATNSYPVVSARFVTAQIFRASIRKLNLLFTF